MKNTVKFLTALILITGLWSCEKEDNFEILAPQPAAFAILTPDSGSSIILNDATPNNTAATFTWEPVSYGTPTTVTYTLQFAKNGTEFAAPMDISSSNLTKASVTVAELNLKALQLGVQPFIEGPIDVRVKSTVGTTGAEPKYSTAITLSVTPFGCLNQYAVGAGLVGAGWNWNNPVVMFCNDGVLTSNVNLANDTFRFFTENGVWGSGRNYLYYTDPTRNFKIVSVLENANDGDKNFKFTGTPGNYEIKVDENNKTIGIARRTVTSGIEPTSEWLVGAATPGGWSWAGSNETELPLVSNGIYEVPVKLTNGDTFRVFLGNNGADSWGLGDRNYPWYVTNGYTISPELVNANDGDSNFRYTGPTGMRLFKIDSVTKTITLN
jgi:starch-binding outer membrane protein SusE/F